MTLRVIIICLIFIFTSIVLILITFIGDWSKFEILQLLIREIASVLLVSCIVSLIWDLWLRRSFLDEVLSRVNLRRDLLDTGIFRINPSFIRIDKDTWDEYFNSVNEIDIFICYGRSWLRNQRENFNKLTQNQDLKIRVIFPNPENVDTMKALSTRFDYNVEKMQSLINESIKSFKNYKDNKNLSINLWLLDDPPLYSMYRFDNVIIFSLFTHRDNVSVPTFFYGSPGTLYDYYIDEFNSLISKSTQIF